MCLCLLYQALPAGYRICLTVPVRTCAVQTSNMALRPPDLPLTYRLQHAQVPPKACISSLRESTSIQSADRKEWPGTPRS